MSLFADGAVLCADDQILLRRKEWFQSVLWSVHNQKLRIDSNPILSGTVFIGKNVTYEIWIEIHAKVYHQKTINEEIIDINLQRVNAALVFNDIKEFHFQKTNTIDDVFDLLIKYDKVTELYPTLKEMETGHPEVRSDQIVRNLTALIEYQKNWEDAQRVKVKIEFLKSIGPPFYSPEGTAEENSLFFTRFAIDEELQGVFRNQENSLWHSILPRMNSCIERNRGIFDSLGLPIDVFEIENHVRFLYQFQTRASICFTKHIESVWMEERTEIVDVILNEVLRKLEFILENGLLMENQLHNLCGDSELSSHFEGIDTLIDRFERLLIRRIKFSQDLSILEMVRFLDKSWLAISHLSGQLSVRNTLRYLHTYCDVENAFIEKLKKQIDTLKDVGPAFFRKLELMKDPVGHVLNFYSKLDAQIVKFAQYSGHLEKDLLKRLERRNYVLINFSDSYSNPSPDGICIFASPLLARQDRYVDSILLSVTQNVLLLNRIPSGCFILLVSDFNRSYWDGDMIDVEMKSPRLPLSDSSVLLFPTYSFDKDSLDGFFKENKYEKMTWFLSSQTQTTFIKIRNNIQLLAFKLLETSKAIPISQEFCSTFYIFHEIFQFTFDFVCDIPEFVRHETLKGGILDGLVDICANWIYFSLKGLESKRDSMRRLVDILGKITTKISIFFEFDGLNHEQFEKIRCAIAAALREIVQRQIYPELDILEKIRYGDPSSEIQKRRECFQPDRETRLMKHINELESKLEIMHGFGLVIDRRETVSLEKDVSKISSNLPIANFKWRKVLYL